MPLPPDVMALIRAEIGMFTIREVAVIIRLHPVTVRRHAREGTLPFNRVGNRWLMPREELLALVGANEREEPPGATED